MPLVVTWCNITFYADSILDFKTFPTKHLASSFYGSWHGNRPWALWSTCPASQLLQQALDRSNCTSDPPGHPHDHPTRIADELFLDLWSVKTHKIVYQIKHKQYNFTAGIRIEIIGGCFTLKAELVPGLPTLLIWVPSEHSCQSDSSTPVGLNIMTTKHVWNINMLKPPTN